MILESRVRAVSRNETVDWNDFSVGVERLLWDVPQACALKVGEAVRQSVRKTAKEVRSGEYGSAGKHEWSPEYMSGFTSKVNAKGMTPEGEVGNKNKPGLVHLLEKGHLTLAGRRTRAYPHMAPAFIEMEEDFMERAKKAIDEALREG